jgi:acetyl-CoA carboxylase carboxyltransferase component
MKETVDKGLKCCTHQMLYSVEGIGEEGTGVAAGVVAGIGAVVGCGFSCYDLECCLGASSSASYSNSSLCRYLFCLGAGKL